MAERLTVAPRSARVIHRLKTWSHPFEDVKCGLKKFEVRRDDRGYEVGDFLVLDAWWQERGNYVTDEKPIVRVITYLLAGGQFGLADGYAVLGIDSLADSGVEKLILDLAPPRETLANA